MAEPKHTVYYGRTTAGWLPDALLLAVYPSFVVALFGLAIHPAPGAPLSLVLACDLLPWVASLAALLLLVAWYPRRISRVGLDSAGVTLIPVVGAVRRLPWFMLQAADADGTTVRLTTEAGQRITVPHLEHAAQLAGRVTTELALRNAASETIEPVDRDLLCEWLGLHPDGSFMVRPGREMSLILGGVVWLALVVSAIAAVSFAGESEVMDALISLFVFGFVYVLYYPLHLAIRLRSDAVRRIFVTPDLIRWRDGWLWHEAPWHAVTTVRWEPRQGRVWTYYPTPQAVEADQEIVVTCGLQNFRFHPKDHLAQPFKRGLDELMAARRAGRIMVPSQAIPAGAISRAEPGQGAAERGVSRV